jgi:ABC-2 type transport system permease protein
MSPSLRAGSGRPGAALSLVFRRQAAAAGRDPGPFFVLPAMPALLMTVVFTALFERISDAPGYEGGDYDAFLIPGVVVLVALLGAGATSTNVAADLRSGYFDRLRLLPPQPVTQLTGRLLFEAARLLPGTTAVLALGFLLGGQNHNGLPGLATVVALVSLLGVAYSGVFHAVAIRTEDPQTPFQLQPLGLPLAFLSTALVPLPVMPTWAETLARYNPVTPVVDASREALLGDLWSHELLAALAVLAGAIAVTQALAWWALHSHLARS